jgi:sorting nexin-1/2
MKHRKSDGRDRGLISSFGSSIVGTKFYEIDEWFDQKKAYLDSLEGQLKGLAKAIDFVAKNRQGLSSILSEGQFVLTPSHRTFNSSQ